MSDFNPIIFFISAIGAELFEDVAKHVGQRAYEIASNLRQPIIELGINDLSDSEEIKEKLKARPEISSQIEAAVNENEPEFAELRQYLDQNPKYVPIVVRNNTKSGVFQRGQQNVNVRVDNHPPPARSGNEPHNSGNLHYIIFAIIIIVIVIGFLIFAIIVVTRQGNQTEKTTNPTPSAQTTITPQNSNEAVGNSNQGNSQTKPGASVTVSSPNQSGQTPKPPNTPRPNDPNENNRKSTPKPTPEEEVLESSKSNKNKN